MGCNYREVAVDVAAVNTGTSDHLDLGANAWSQKFVVRAVHADGTPAPVRAKHSTLDSGADPAAAADMIICQDGGPYTFTAGRSGATTLRYLNVLGLSDTTILSVSRLTMSVS